MTREEAINHLKDILAEATETEDAVCYVTNEDAEALEMAIEALELKKQHLQATCDEIKCCCPKNRITYSVICERMPNPHIYFDTYEETVHWAEINQPEYRPWYIIERLEQFRVCGVKR
jgi:predicted ATP-grasp superfamily ATP-dependent carboligase